MNINWIHSEQENISLKF